MPIPFFPGTVKNEFKPPGDEEDYFIVNIWIDHFIDAKNLETADFPEKSPLWYPPSGNSKIMLFYNSVNIFAPNLVMAIVCSK